MKKYHNKYDQELNSEPVTSQARGGLAGSWRTLTLMFFFFSVFSSVYHNHL